MRQEIHFKGLSLTPDNHHAELGALSMCAGVELHDGALRPSVMPHSQISSKLPVPESELAVPITFYDQYTATLRFVHQGNGYTHFIGTFIKTDIPTKDDVYWYDEEGHDLDHFYGGKLTGIFASTITDIQAMGNTLIFICTTGIYYVLWKDGGYKTLGEKPPFVKLQFSLASYEYTGDPLQEMSTAPGDMYDLANQQNLVANIKDEYQTEFTENAYALINRVHNEITEAGAFYAPFFIRYCYRLFDGTSFVLHSPPVLMPVCVGHDDRIKIRGLRRAQISEGVYGITTTANVDKRIQIIPIAAKLQYKCNSSASWNALKSDWSDIVSSVDIFISQPITRTRQGEHFTKVGMLSGSTWKLYGGAIYVESGGDIYSLNPELDNDAYHDKLFTPDIFFKVASFSLKDDMETSSFVDLPIRGSVLSTLAQTRMQDDYHTHHHLQAGDASNSHSYVYNKRLHVFSANEMLFEGFQEDTLLPYFSEANGGEEIDRIYVHLSTEDGEKIVYAQGSLLSNLPIDFRNGLPIFYPDSRAYQMVIVTKATSTQASVTYTFPMTKLPLLEGAVTQGNYTTGGNIPQTLNSIVPTPNKIYVSEISNPFFFPLESRVTVGIGTVIALATTTRALSQGQFGQYPLIAFCSDGIWALDVSSTGTYQSVHPISREVCVNPASVCQLDQSVFFATSRGLSRIVESQVVSVSDALDGPLFDAGSKLFSSEQFDDQGTEDLLDLSIHPIDFFKGGMLVYDFINSRVIVVKQVENAAYVLSLRDGTWSTMCISAPLAIANAYPYPYYQSSGGSLWHLDKGYDYSNNSTNAGLVVTRSISFATTMQVIQAFQQLNDCGVVPLLYLHGSNDDITWKFIGKVQRNHAPYLPGHPYRFFCISIYLKMMTWEKYSSLILDVIEKYEKL